MSQNSIRLPQFLAQTDELTSQLSAEELRTFIHEIARTFSETNRSSFITKLQGMKESGKVAADHENINHKIDIITQNLIKIQRGEISLDSKYNEEWDDWNNSDEEEFFFSDPHNLLEDVRQAIEMIHTCIDQEFFEKSSMELSELLSVLEVQTKGDYLDYNGNSLTICDIYVYGLLKGDYHRFVNECLYLTYMGPPAEKRPEKLYEMIKNMEDGQLVRLEEIMRLGNGELPESDRFLKDWLRYLGNQDGRRAERLLTEVQSMISDDKVLLENARIFAKNHPSLYLSYLREKKSTQNAKYLWSVGCEALAEIPVSYVIRAQIALLTADYANQLQQREKAEWCWLEAFRSDTSVINYMRLRFEMSDWKWYKEKIRNIIEDRFQNSKTQSEWMVSDECQKNLVFRNTYCTLMYLEQDFEQMRNIGMTTKAPLGWSGTFMKEGISLMLLLLYADNVENDKLSAGLKEMQDRAISACSFRPEEYMQGVNESRNTVLNSLFDGLFSRWKSTVSMAEEEQKRWIQRIDHWMEYRIQGIMQESRRNYYGECAAFLAALGEVLESRGESGAKGRYFERYRSKYPRRRSFIEAMRRYGMM